jgi:preprotein translocase subunit SecE
LAAKDKKPATKKTLAGETKVTRIVASDDKKTAKTKSVAKKPRAVKVTKPKEASTQPANSFGRLATPFIAMGRYFMGAWYELRQVRWPNRKATWSLTAAMLVFTAFFVVLILLLDALFKYLFQLILG